MFVVTCFWVVVVKNGSSLLDHWTLKSTIYLKNELMKWGDFLHADTNLGKLNVNIIIIGWVCSKIGEPFSSRDSKIRCISQMMWWIEQTDEWFLHADSDGIILGLITNLLCPWQLLGVHCSCTC